VAAENAYNERVVSVKNQIIVWLRDRLGTAGNANEMFRVSSKFNTLFVRRCGLSFNSCLGKPC
jgi:dynein heavy chain 1